jgi:WhiB family transcriptional regulator, redox-sensing transcriptional regulator
MKPQEKIKFTLAFDCNGLDDVAIHATTTARKRGERSRDIYLCCRELLCNVPCQPLVQRHQSMSEYGIVDVWSESKNVFELIRPAWQQHGTCRGEGTDIFFHERYLHAVREAKKLCDICVVRQSCLDFAIKNDCVGVWGGLTTVERRNEIRRRRRDGTYVKSAKKKRYASRIAGGEVLPRPRPSKG